MMVSHCETEVEEAKKKAPQAKPDLDRMAQQLQDLFKFRNLYDHMDFTTDK